MVSSPTPLLVEGGGTHISLAVTHHPSRVQTFQNNDPGQPISIRHCKVETAIK